MLTNFSEPQGSVLDVSMSNLSHHHAPFVSGNYEDQFTREEHFASTSASPPDTILVPNLHKGGEKTSRKYAMTLLRNAAVDCVTAWYNQLVRLTFLHGRLLKHFEEYDGANVSRETIYHAYTEYSFSQGLEAMNTATFGKLIRGVFPKIQTRRLGVRGQSKYHYNGIRVRPESQLAMVDNNTVVDPKPLIRHKRKKDRNDGENNHDVGESIENKSQEFSINEVKPLLARPVEEPLSAIRVSEFPGIPMQIIDMNMSSQHAQLFMSQYNRLSFEIVNSINNHKSEEIEGLLYGFWCNLTLDFETFTHSVAFSRFITDCDVIFYSDILNVVKENILKKLDATSIQTLEIVAFHFDNWITASLASLPQSFALAKIMVAKCFTLALKRALSVINLVQTVQIIMANHNFISKMVNDWRGMDREFINEYTAWSCQWQEEFLVAVEEEIITNVKRRASADHWSIWLESLVKKSVHFPAENEDQYDIISVEMNAKYFLTKFSFFTAQLARDMTIRSTSSFVHWQSLRSFIDEYIWYTVTNNVSTMKLSRLRRQGQECPANMNGLLFYFLDQRNYFGFIAPPRSQSFESMPQVPIPEQPTYFEPREHSGELAGSFANVHTLFLAY